MLIFVEYKRHKMESLFEFQASILKGVTKSFKRYLFDQISWGERMIGIKGPRGSGKTTLILQHLKYDLDINEALYVTADHTWFYTHTLFEVANEWNKQGGKYLFIDEVHKYTGWSRELKNIYDGLPELKVVFTASSALDIYRGEADISRRVVSYLLTGLSFREYLLFRDKIELPVIGLEDMLKKHVDFSMLVSNEIKPLVEFRKYLEYGYLPIIAEGVQTYKMKLNGIINTIVDTDLSYISSYNSGTAYKIKKLLGVIAQSVPFKPNIASIASKLDLSRDSVYQYIYTLRDAALLNTLSFEGKGVSILQKPEKIYLENTNLSYVFQEQPEVGNIRETFVLNQLINSGKEVFLSNEGDFLTANFTIEVGGKNKTAAQVKHLHNYLIAADNIEVGFGHKVPVWLFGFLY